MSTENSRFTNDPRSITSLLHGTSHQLSPEVEGGGVGGGGRKRVRRRRGRRSEDFGVEWHAFQGDQVNYTVRQPNPPIPPHPPFPSGNKHDRFFNRKL